MAGRFYQTSGLRYSLTDTALNVDAIRQLNALGKLEKTRNAQSKALKDAQESQTVAKMAQSLEKQEVRIKKLRDTLKMVLA